jgi:hypothetical protein
MAVLYSFFDESGKFKTKDVIAVGSICADLHSMTAFDRIWRRELRRVALPCIKMSDAIRYNTALSERVPAQSLSERIEVLRPFIMAIRDHAQLALGLALDVEAFKELKKDFRFELGSVDDPHYLMFMRTFLRLIEECGDGDYVSLICDDEEQTAEPCYKYYRRIKKIDPTRGAKLGSIGFADDEVFPGIQAADMLAWLTRLYAEKKFFGRPFDYEELFYPFESPKKNLHLGFYDRERLNKLTADGPPPPLPVG